MSQIAFPVDNLSSMEMMRDMMNNAKLKEWIRRLAFQKGHDFQYASDEGVDEILGRCPHCRATWHFVLTPPTVGPLVQQMGSMEALRSMVATGLKAIREGMTCAETRTFRETVLNDDLDALANCIAIGDGALSHLAKADDPLRPPAPKAAASA